MMPSTTTLLLFFALQASGQPLIAGQDLVRPLGQPTAGQARPARSMVAPSAAELRDRERECTRRWFGRTRERQRLEAANLDPCASDVPAISGRVARTRPAGSGL